VLVNNLILWDKYTEDDLVDIKKHEQHALDIQANLPGLRECGDEGLFH
jgi:hypothetical protein